MYAAEADGASNVSHGDVKLIWFEGLFHEEEYYGQHTIDLIENPQPATFANVRIGLIADDVTPQIFVPKSIPAEYLPMREADSSIQ